MNRMKVKSSGLVEILGVEFICGSSPHSNLSFGASPMNALFRSGFIQNTQWILQCTALGSQKC